MMMFSHMNRWDIWQWFWLWWWRNTFKRTNTKYNKFK